MIRYAVMRYGEGYVGNEYTFQTWLTQNRIQCSSLHCKNSGKGIGSVNHCRQPAGLRHKPARCSGRIEYSLAKAAYSRVDLRQVWRHLYTRIGVWLRWPFQPGRTHGEMMEAELWGRRRCCQGVICSTSLDYFLMKWSGDSHHEVVQKQISALSLSLFMTRGGETMFVTWHQGVTDWVGHIHHFEEYTWFVCSAVYILEKCDGEGVTFPADCLIPQYDKFIVVMEGDYGMLPADLTGRAGMFHLDGNEEAGEEKPFNTSTRKRVSPREVSVACQLEQRIYITE